jgi:hypothetical protein
VPVEHPIGAPLRRPLRIFSFDPMSGRGDLGTTTVEVANESLDPGPVGARVAVIDYDGTRNRYYPPVDLDEPAILMQGGLAPTEADPRFHQQMVYAVTTKVLENFDRALGRRITFKRGPLKLFPHAFRGPNAFFESRLNGVCFGYFTADQERPGRNLPGQTVFAALSQDIIAHEVTHAIVHRMREHFLDPTNADVLAFHEGFADIVAIFQHFTFPEVLRDAIGRTKGELASSDALVDLATQFGHATGKEEALRRAVDQPDPSRYWTVLEPHARGSLLVAAVFDAFFSTYQERSRDLIRIATAGSGVLPAGDLHPDLVDRLATEAARTAQEVLTMCIRAFEYLPPVDITFGDYLRALVTADFDLLAEDGAALRRAMIEAFRRRGIFPEDVGSLAEDALLWPEIVQIDERRRMPVEAVAHQMLSGAQDFQPRPRGPRGSTPELGSDAAKGLWKWAKKNAVYLHLDPDPDSKIETQGFHATYRVRPSGALVIEVVAQFVQMRNTEGDSRFGGLPLRGGTTVVATAAGDVRFLISKPLDSPALPEHVREAARRREARQLAFVERSDLNDPALPWAAEEYVARRMQVSLRQLHQGLMT